MFGWFSSFLHGAGSLSHYLPFFLSQILVHAVRTTARKAAAAPVTIVKYTQYEQDNQGCEGATPFCLSFWNPETMNRKSFLSVAALTGIGATLLPKRGNGAPIPQPVVDTPPASIPPASPAPIPEYLSMFLITAKCPNLWGSSQATKASNARSLFGPTFNPLSPACGECGYCQMNEPHNCKATAGYWTVCQNFSPGFKYESSAVRVLGRDGRWYGAYIKIDDGMTFPEAKEVSLAAEAMMTFVKEITPLIA